MSLLQQLAQELGVTPQAIGSALSVGLRSAQLDALRAVNEQARQLDAVLTAQEDEQMAPILAKRAQRAQILAAHQQHENEQRAQSEGAVNVPDWAALESQLRGE